MRQLGDDVLVGAQQEAAGSAGRVGDPWPSCGCTRFGHQLDDVARGAKLAVFTGGGDFGQQHFIDIALDVLKGLAVLAASPSPSPRIFRRWSSPLPPARPAWG